MNKKLLFVDIKKRVELSGFLDTINSLDIEDYDIITLTPYSVYLCEFYKLEYKTFHSFITVEEFRDNVLSKINLFEKNLGEFYIGLMIDLIPIISFFEYEKQLLNIYEQNKNGSVLIRDNNSNNYNYTNKSSFLNILKFEKKIFIGENPLRLQANRTSKFKDLSLFFKKLIIKLFKMNISYDWINYLFFILFNRKFEKKYDSPNYEQVSKKTIENLIKEQIKSEYLQEKILKKLENFYIKNKSNTNNISYRHWNSDSAEFVNAYNEFSIFYQHGNYFYKNMIFKYSEIAPADLCFVFNDYTKKLFENLGAKKVFSVGSILFNKPIKERKKKYDFLYITQGHDYTGNLQYVDFPNSLHSFDGYELYQRHKSIIELFGTKFKDKKIIIRVHPTVLTNGVYVPFWELAESYTNITVDVSIPIHTLIEKSNFIISDYFTSEFINRELHYKRDILLFQGAPTPIPEETIEDMKKMFILVDTVEDLEEKVKNIEIITKDRPRYDNIIEYYSSKECDTKKVVTEILEKELNARINS